MEDKVQISRVRRSRSSARRAYDRMSRYYDRMAEASEGPLARRGIALLEVRQGERVLETGCGTGGALMEIAARVGETGCVHGADLSAGMLEQVRRKLAKDQLNQNITPSQARGKTSHAIPQSKIFLCQADGMHLPYRSTSFEAVMLCFTLELFDTPEIPSVLSECRRVLKPGGRVGVVCLHRPADPNRIVRLYEWFHAALPEYIDCRPIDASEMLLQAGFTVGEREIKKMWGLPVELVVGTRPFEANPER